MHAINNRPGTTTAVQDTTIDVDYTIDLLNVSNDYLEELIELMNGGQDRELLAECHRLFQRMYNLQSLSVDLLTKHDNDLQTLMQARVDKPNQDNLKQEA